MSKPDIQHQLRCHIEACKHARLGLKLAKEGRRRQALKAAVEAERWERLYRKYGGKGPILGVE
jgi:hypothetical protein